MNRLLKLQQELTSEPVFFQKYRKATTIDPETFKKVIYGPNWKAREDSLKVIKDNEDIF